MVLMATGVTLRSILGSASAMVGLVAFELGVEIGADDAERFREFSASCGIQAGKGVLDHVVGKAAEMAEQRVRLGGEEDQPGATVGRIAAALDQACLFEAVDHAAQGD